MHGLSLAQGAVVRMRTEIAGAWGLLLESGAGHCKQVFGVQLHPILHLGVRMEGECQDELVHRTSPRFVGETDECYL